MSRPPYPHRLVPTSLREVLDWHGACRCGEPVTTKHRWQMPAEWGAGCRAAMEERIADLEARLDAAIKRADEAEARCDALEERMVTADVPWRVHGCRCPADSKPSDRCNHQWTRCNGRLQWLKAFKAKEVS